MTDTPTENGVAGCTFQTYLSVFLFLLVFRLVRAYTFKRDPSNDDCKVDRVFGSTAASSDPTFDSLSHSYLLPRLPLRRGQFGIMFFNV